MPKRWPMWFGFGVGLIALSLGIVSGSSLDEGWQLAH